MTRKIITEWSKETPGIPIDQFPDRALNQPCVLPMAEIQSPPSGESGGGPRSDGAMLSARRRGASPTLSCFTVGDASSGKETPLEQARKHAKPCSTTVGEEKEGTEVDNPVLVLCKRCGNQYGSQVLPTVAEPSPGRCPRCCEGARYWFTDGLEYYDES